MTRPCNEDNIFLKGRRTGLCDKLLCYRGKKKSSAQWYFEALQNSSTKRATSACLCQSPDDLVVSLWVLEERFEHQTELQRRVHGCGLTWGRREARGFGRACCSLSLSLSTAPLMCFSHGTLFTAEGKEAGIILPSRAAGKVPLCRFPLVKFISTSWGSPLLICERSTL